MIKKLYFAAFFILFLAGGCAVLPENINRSYSEAFTDTDTTALGKVVNENSAVHPGKSGFVLLGNGLDAYVARAVLAEVAERSIDVQYYLYHNDLVGLLFSYKLLQAADRGVRVRLLVDDIGTAGRDLGIATLASHPNIEIRLFNPFSRFSLRGLQYLIRFGSVTRRMHNKSFTVDNQVTIVGGRNIGNEYFEADPDLVFGDLDVLAVGPVVREVSISFDKYWNSELAYPIATMKGKEISIDNLDTLRPDWQQFVEEQENSEYAAALRNSEFAQMLRQRRLNEKFSWGEAKAVYDQPEKISNPAEALELHLANQLAPYIKDLSSELIILSAYFVPGREGVEFLKKLRKKGIRVRILTNSLASTDVTVVHAGYGKYRREMLRADIELYELNKKITREERKEKKGTGGSSKASLHAKAFILDRENLFIGSFNFDPRSFDQNTEIGIIFNSPELGRLMGEQFDAQINNKAFKLELHEDEDGVEFIRWVTRENGQEKMYVRDPHTSFWRRFLVGLASLLPIESQL
ncbi:MAG: phospholipase D family protein [Desulfobulbaceae bacterium]|nr:phospholipase D family protein [Desulfobulbaceae bacterium]